jgi:hypothetical protein
MIMKSVVLLSVLLLVGTTELQAETLSKSAERELGRKGATCDSHKQPEASGETHRCLFKLDEFDGRDFSTELGRGAYVISEIGHRCDEVEILDDVDYTREGESSPSLRRVSAKCFR